MWGRSPCSEQRKVIQRHFSEVILLVRGHGASLAYFRSAGMICDGEAPEGVTADSEMIDTWMAHVNELAQQVGVEHV